MLLIIYLINGDRPNLKYMEGPGKTPVDFIGLWIGQMYSTPFEIFMHYMNLSNMPHNTIQGPGTETYPAGDMPHYTL